jgi:hypothetical protein
MQNFMGNQKVADPAPEDHRSVAVDDDLQGNGGQHR